MTLPTFKKQIKLLIIDHYFWSPSIEPNVSDAGVIHHNGNMSDHAFIYCSVDFHASVKLPDLDPRGSPPVLKPSWKRATTERAEASLAFHFE